MSTPSPHGAALARSTTGPRTLPSGMLSWSEQDKFADAFAERIRNSYWEELEALPTTTPTPTPITATTAQVAPPPDPRPRPRPRPAASGQCSHLEPPSRPRGDRRRRRPSICVCAARPRFINLERMIQCDHVDCPINWFHLKCVGLRDHVPVRTGWLCPTCRPLVSDTKKQKEQGKKRFVCENGGFFPLAKTTLPNLPATTTLPKKPAKVSSGVTKTRAQGRSSGRLAAQRKPASPQQR